jgi:hypothetical protein
MGEGDMGVRLFNFFSSFMWSWPTLACTWVWPAISKEPVVVAGAAPMVPTSITVIFSKELMIFTGAVSGSSGMLHHALHYYGFT